MSEYDVLNGGDELNIKSILLKNLASKLIATIIAKQLDIHPVIVINDLNIKTLNKVLLFKLDICGEINQEDLLKLLKDKGN